MGHPRLDLRISGGIQEQVCDVADDRFEAVSRRGGQGFPGRIVAEYIPFGVHLGQVGETQHVSQIRQAWTDQRVSVEDLRETRLLEDLELSVMEHLDLADMVLAGRAVVGAPLKATLDVLRGCGGYNDLGPALEGDEQRALNPDKCRFFGRRVPEGLGRLHERIIVGQTQLGGGKRFERSARPEQVEGRSLRAYVEIEGTDGRDAKPVERGYERVGYVSVGELRLGTRLQVILAKLIVFARLPRGRLRLGLFRECESGCGEGRSQELASFHGGLQSGSSGCRKAIWVASSVPCAPVISRSSRSAPRAKRRVPRRPSALFWRVTPLPRRALSELRHVFPMHCSAERVLLRGASIGGLDPAQRWSGRAGSPGLWLRSGALHSTGLRSAPGRVRCREEAQ